MLVKVPTNGPSENISGTFWSTHKSISDLSMIKSSN